MGDDGRLRGLLHDYVQIVGEVGSERRDTHRRAIAQRALSAEEAARLPLPALATADYPQ